MALDEGRAAGPIFLVTCAALVLISFFSSVVVAQDTTRKLKPGELLEVREWAKKQEETGLMRMKCKAKSDGLVGWVTTIGNTGIRFVDIV